RLRSILGRPVIHEACRRNRPRSRGNRRNEASTIDRSALAALRRLYARRFVLLLRIMRRPGRIALPSGLLARGEPEERKQRARLRVDPRMRVAETREPLRDGGEGELGRVYRGHFLP